VLGPQACEAWAAHTERWIDAEAEVWQDGQDEPERARQARVVQQKARIEVRRLRAPHGTSLTC
jgi:hypothetical protein